MNMVELQLDFYRRCSDAAAKLHMSRCGTLCTLLGLPEIAGAASVTCSLSMGVTVLARRLDSGYLKIESTASDICKMFSLSDAFKGSNKPEREINLFMDKTGFNGAEILYDSDAPESIDIELSLRTAVLKVLINLIHADTLSAEDTAFLCCGGKNVQLYQALISAKKGWCCYMDKSSVQHYPLPMTGLIFLLIKGRSKPHYPKAALLNKELDRLKKLHPSIYTHSDIKTDDIKNGRFSYLPFIAEENERINHALDVLRNCNIDGFAGIVNESSRSFIEYLNPSDEQSFSARILPNIEGCICARPFNDMVYAIAEEKMADYVSEKIKAKFEDRFGYEPDIFIVKNDNHNI